jgi:mycothiol system anti-sigma-R factor
MSQRDCDHAVEYLYQYLDRQVTWRRKVKIRRHLRRCGYCGGAYAFEEHLIEVVSRRCRDEPPPELIDRLRTLIREQGPGSTPG